MKMPSAFVWGFVGASALLTTVALSRALASTSDSAEAASIQDLGRADVAIPTVSYVDVKRYMGRWYEIARLPQSFEENCVAVTAAYALRDDGKVDVMNRCRMKSFNGKTKIARGVAKIVDHKTNAKLKVTFFWPFYGDYWILELGANYEYAVVGAPDRESLWILSRTPHLPQHQLKQIVARARARYGRDLHDLILTPQP